MDPLDKAKTKQHTQNNNNKFSPALCKFVCVCLPCKVLYFVPYLISQISRISRGGQIRENKSLAKIVNPNTFNEQTFLICEIKS